VGVPPASLFLTLIRLLSLPPSLPCSQEVFALDYDLLVVEDSRVASLLGKATLEANGTSLPSLPPSLPPSMSPSLLYHRLHLVEPVILTP